MLNLLIHAERTILSPLHLHFLRLTSQDLLAADSCEKATFAVTVPDSFPLSQFQSELITLDPNFG